MPRESRIRFARLSGALLAVLGGAALWPADARAQVAGTSNKPLPDVMLLVDTSGSMERMSNGALPDADAATQCQPGVESEPNRWGMLLQALTGNLQPYYSCEALSRLGSASPPKFKREYGINDKDPYDLDYFLPYHRPMTGTDANNACLISPYKLPGATSGGVGPSKRTAGGNASDFPDDALVTVTRKALNDSSQNLSTVTECAFDQTADGQLDAARDYVRFALMTFDNDPSGATGASADLKLLTVADPFGGQWSYRRSPDNPFFSANGSTDGSARGNPAACAAQDFEVGARNEAAPPWEGRLVPFPPPTASLFDIQRTNAQIQKVLLASRPYGATPLAGMLDDARDFFWHRAGGPKDDPYFCRDKYIIMLTDGAPNQDLRPSCEGGPDGACPYEKVEDIADKLATDASRPVKTYVIGFSVNGSGSFPAENDGFPAGITNCKAWYDAAGNNPTDMQSECNTRIGDGQVPAGSTAAACCTLNNIALKGSNGATGPYFAESQADIVLSFGQIMADIVKEASTRTLPAYTPTADFSVASFGTTGTRSGQFIGSFIPNVQRPWSGEIDRTRFACASGAPTEELESVDKGDFMSANVAVQSTAKERVFLSVIADADGAGSIDSAGTIRPFANGSPEISTGKDDIPASSGREVKMLNDNTFSIDWPTALDITDKTCKRSKAVKRGAGAGARGTITIPALDKDDCTKAVWGFTTAYPGALKLAPAVPSEGEQYDFNVRCGGGNSSTTGMCSISGAACTLGEAAAGCGVGEVCVPECAALGAIFRSNPTVIGPPTGFLREDGFRTFQAARRTRRPTLFVATIDGILHAFKAMDEGGTDARHELWSFVPPAVLPKLATNYPAGNQILLDGSPVVRETIWDRGPGDVNKGADSGRDWHTTLVAGLGAGGGGYYALNVTDADCSGKESNTGDGKDGDCRTGNNYEAPAQGNRSDVSTGGYIDSATKRGPHFLWQLTDVPKGTDDKAKVVRTRSGVDRVALFGRQSGTPAIGTVQIMVDGVERQIGVAILPGGIDGAPASGTCSRLGSSGDFAMHDTQDNTGVRERVRQWGKSCDAPVPGRGVTIARLDTGEVVRHFGRMVGGVPTDAPISLTTKTTHVPFDSPMIGVPVVYPDVVGVPIQKIFIGDADGTLWRIDLTNTDPTKWSGALFQDLYAFITGPGAATAGQPIQIPPVLSTNDAGQLIVNVATGDQENLVHSGDANFVYSLREDRDGATLLPKARINWYRQLEIGGDGARVTGPMVVFDRTLYFATYTPRLPPAGDAAACLAGGEAHLWGFHYTRPADGGISAGGFPRYCVGGDVGTSGICNSTIDEKEAQGSDLIPGVTVRASVACASPANPGDTGGAFAFSAITPQQYQLSFGVATRLSKDKQPPVAGRNTVRQPTPRNSTRIDSWALVIE